ncbi:MAG TPA: M67 family metallopeptidase [Tepidisphaeraceae bacterium]|nr:M67 family metallopeptidase [Tepidisphaeraceae bacterium]
MSPVTLHLPAAIKQQIDAEGVRAFPNECCGILIGRDLPGGRRVVDRLVPMANTFDPAEQYHRFTVDPRAQIQAEKSADAEGKSVLGYYHSHPNHPAKPSEYDRQHMPPFAFYSQVIVSIVDRQPADLTCWYLDEDTEQFVQTPVVVE